MEEKTLKLKQENEGLEEANNTLKGGINESKEEENQEHEERQRKATLLYRKRIREAIPTGARINKNVIVVLNNELSDQLEAILKLAFQQTQNRKRKTISGNDTKRAIIEYKKTGATFILDDFQTVFDGKLKEMKQNIKGG